MRALTLTQPWAGLVASGLKLVENRPRSMIRREDFGKPFALHASRETDDSVYDRIADIAPELVENEAKSTMAHLPPHPWLRLSRITSAVIAIATIDGVVESTRAPMQGLPPALRVRHWADRLSPFPEDQRRWFFGPIGYVLRDVRVLTSPVPCRGWQGFWTLSDDLERQVRAAMPEGPR